MRCHGRRAIRAVSVRPIFSLYAMLVEAKSLWRFAGSMLSTYVGREPARFILEGQVRRGDVRTITAALMLVDLRNFTLLSDRETPRSVIRMPND